MPPIRLIRFACAVLAATALAACSTDEVHPNIVIVSSVTDGTPSSSERARLWIYLVLDGVYSQDVPPAYTPLPGYRLLADGRFAAWGDPGSYTYVETFPDNMTGLSIDAGTHILGLVDSDDHVAFTTAPIEVRGGMTTEVVIYGDTTSMHYRSMIDDPSAVPAGSFHMRLVNALDDHGPVELVQCANGLDGSCVPLTAPVAYGDLAEMDVTAAVAQEVAWRWASPTVSNPVANSMSTLSSGPPTPFATRIPVHVDGPAGTCPSCVYAQF